MNLQKGYSKLWAVAGVILCCLILILGIQNVASAFLRHAEHPGWDFVLRHGEVSCLTDIRVDPYDVFSGAVQDNRYRPYKLKYELDVDALDYHWCAGYSPWEYTLVLPFSFLSIRLADAIYKGLELVALAIVLWLTFRQSKRFAASEWTKMLLAYSFFLLPPEAWDYSFRYGNWSILFCAGAFCLIVFLDKGWQTLAGLAWAFLMVKPQQGIWFAIPILFRRQFKTVAVAVATCLTASIPPSILCGKSPITLILEIPRFRLSTYFETSLFPRHIYSFGCEWLFPKAPLFLGLLFCLVFTLWASWRLRKEKDWFSTLQPTFFCICAGYPLWHQDWLFCFFPILYLLEIWANSGKYSRRIRTISLLLAIALTNPLSWVRYNFRVGFGTILSESEVLSYAIWGLFILLLFLVQSSNHIEETDAGLSDDSTNPLGALSGKPPSMLPYGNVRETVSAFVLLTVCLAVLVPVAFLKNGSFLGIDDANIYFGYAENLCHGRGISYAQNGVHCEGTTSMLWLLACSLCFKLRLNEPGVLAVSLALLLFAQWMWLKTLAELLPSRNRSPVFFFVYIVMVLSSAGYVAWMSVTLMDTVLWGFVVAWMTLSLFREMGPEPGCLRNRLVAAIPFALAPWARPEAMFVVPCGLALCVIVRRLRGRDNRNEFVWGAAFLVSLAVLTGFRLAYFGFPFPNTYYAKVSPSFAYNVHQGSKYLLGFLRSGIFPYLATIAFGISVAKMIVWMVCEKANRADTFPDVNSLWLWGLILVLPPVFAGGDHFGYFRFFQPIWPLLCVLLVTTVSAFHIQRSSYSTRIDWACIVAWFAFVLFAGFSSWRKIGGPNPSWLALSPIQHEFEIAATEQNNGQILSRIFSDQREIPVLGVISAGGISRTYPGRIVDLMGLNNTKIAHYPGNRFGMKNLAAFEPELFREMDVDLMPFEPTQFRSRVLKGMLETESFVSNWRCGKILKKATGEETPPYFVENGFLDRLLSTGDFSFRDSYRFEDGFWKEIKEGSVID